MKIIAHQTDADSPSIEAKHLVIASSVQELRHVANFLSQLADKLEPIANETWSGPAHEHLIDYVRLNKIDMNLDGTDLIWYATQDQYR